MKKVLLTVLSALLCSGLSFANKMQKQPTKVKSVKKITEGDNECSVLNCTVACQ